MIKHIGLLVLAACLLFSATADAGLQEELQKYIQQQRGGDEHDQKKSGDALDARTVADGLKEALSVSVRNSVANVSRVDGYFSNELIRIAMPDNIARIEKLMRQAGLGKEVDKFLLSMNRAAEKAAPQALDIFTTAVKEMTIPDAVQILRGNDTAATQYLRSHTYDRMSVVFSPIISSAMNDVGVTRSFKEMMDKARSIPFLKQETVDLDEYVTTKALDGLFVVVGQEEQKIRKDPAARTTDLAEEGL